MKAHRQFTVLAYLGVAALALLLGAASPAQATQYTFTYNDGTSIANGTLTATANGDGTYTAISGTLDVTAGQDGSSGGTIYNLFFNPNGTGQSTSPSGYFYYDNQLLPAQDPLITNNGLLFTGHGIEINIFSNGPGPNYQFYDNTGFTSYPGAFTLAAVPEPAYAQMAGMLALGGIGILRHRRSKRA